MSYSANQRRKLRRLIKKNRRTPYLMEAGEIKSLRRRLIKVG